MAEKVTRSDIAQGLAALGIAPADVILVHSSLNSLGEVEGGADAVIDGLLDAVGAEGTVIVPTLTGSPEDSPDNPPHFDVRETPCWTGVIPETFRQRWDAVRSLHPTHSVACVGPLAYDLVRGHEQCPTPCGRGTPYYRMAIEGGKIVLLGVDLNSCTTVHTVEELAESPWHLLPEPVAATIVDENGQKRTVRVRLHRWGIERDFTVLEPALRERELIQVGKIGEAEVRVIDAKGLIDTGVELLQENPTLFLVNPDAVQRLLEQEEQEEGEQ